MGIRFRKRIKILPGVHINLSRSGISTSLGVRGASITKGHGQIRTNLGIPGSGISHNTVTADSRPNNDDGGVLTRSADKALTVGAESALHLIGKAFVLVFTIMLAVLAAILSPRKRRR